MALVTEDQLARFWAKVEIHVDGCWLWSAYRSPLGYGRFTLRAGEPVLAHRFAYEVCVGSIPAGLELDHLCRNPSCVRPDHLEPVLHRVNVLRGRAPAAAHALATHCPKGHPYEGSNLIVTSANKRRCRSCHYAANAARRRGHKERVI